MVLPFLRKRSKIIEIVAARDIVFALAQSGVCAAFSRGIDCLSTVSSNLWFSLHQKVEWKGCNVFLLFLAETNQRICFLNVTPDEVIRSLFYNKNNDSLITVSVYASDNFSSLKCRSTRIEYVNLFTHASASHPPSTHISHLSKLCRKDQEEIRASRFSGFNLFSPTLLLLTVLSVPDI
jgi:hypothetical protein